MIFKISSEKKNQFTETTYRLVGVESSGAAAMRIRDIVDGCRSQ